jgi:hypothetical protein
MKTKIQFFTCLLLSLLAAGSVSAQTPVIKGVWSLEKANTWYATHKWLSGADYIPCYGDQSTGNVAGRYF